MSRITSPDQIEIGMKVFYARCIGECFISSYTITSKPYIDKNVNLLFVDWDNGDYHLGSFSLDDCNVITNSYNKHRLYTKEEEAKAYIQYMKRRNLVPGYNIGTWDDYDDYSDDFDYNYGDCDEPTHLKEEY